MLTKSLDEPTRHWGPYLILSFVKAQRVWRCDSTQVLTRPELLSPDQTPVYLVRLVNVKCVFSCLCFIDGLSMCLLMVPKILSQRSLLCGITFNPCDPCETQSMHFKCLLISAIDSHFHHSLDDVGFVSCLSLALSQGFKQPHHLRKRKREVKQAPKFSCGAS